MAGSVNLLSSASFDVTTVTMQVRVYPALALTGGSRAASELWPGVLRKVVQTSHPSLLLFTVAFLVILLVACLLVFSSTFQCYTSHNTTSNIPSSPKNSFVHTTFDLICSPRVIYLVARVPPT